MPRATEDLAYIRQVIADSRRAVALDATPFLVWGALVVVGILAELAVVRSSIGVGPVWIWALLVAAGLAVSALSWRRRRHRSGSLTLADRALGALWMGCWTAMVVIGFGGFFLADLSGAALIAPLAAVMGTGFFVTGVLADHLLVRWLGIAWWLVAVTLFPLSGTAALIGFGVAMVLFQVLPGLLLQHRWRLPAAAGDGP